MSCAEGSAGCPRANPRGTTIVTWTVADAAGNTAQATQQVTVKQASVADELDALAALIDSWNLRKPLSDHLDHRVAKLETDLAHGRAHEFCAGLADLARRARAEAGKKLTLAESAQILADVAQIATGAGC